MIFFFSNYYLNLLHSHLILPLHYLILIRRHRRNPRPFLHHILQSLSRIILRSNKGLDIPFHRNKGDQLRDTIVCIDLWCLVMFLSSECSFQEKYLCEHIIKLIVKISKILYSRFNIWHIKSRLELNESWFSGECLISILFLIFQIISLDYYIFIWRVMKKMAVLNFMVVTHACFASNL